MKRFATALLVSSLLMPSFNSAETLGRLFFTPAQRNTLDAGKQLDRPKSAGPTVRGPRSLTVNGIVTRSDGESTVWVNGGAAGVKRRDAATISATPSNAATARVQVTGTSTKLRVGQTLDRATGRITESYESRPAATRRPPERAAKPEASQDVTAGGGGADQSSNAVEPDNGRTAP